MTKYGIFAVKKEKENGQYEKIIEVMVYEMEDENTPNENTMKKIGRFTVEWDIRLGHNEYITLYKDENGDWRDGAKVKVVKIEDLTFLKTIPNGIEEDNLGELPEYE